MVKEQKRKKTRSLNALQQKSVDIENRFKQSNKEGKAMQIYVKSSVRFANNSNDDWIVSSQYTESIEEGRKGLKHGYCECYDVNNASLTETSYWYLGLRHGDTKKYEDGELVEWKDYDNGIITTNYMVEEQINIL